MINLDNMRHFKELSDADMLSVAKMAGFLKVPGKDTALIAHPHVLDIIIPLCEVIWQRKKQAPAVVTWETEFSEEGLPKYPGRCFIAPANCTRDLEAVRGHEYFRVVVISTDDDVHRAAKQCARGADSSSLHFLPQLSNTKVFLPLRVSGDPGGEHPHHRGRPGWFNPEVAPTIGAGINASELNLLRSQIQDARFQVAALESEAVILNTKLRQAEEIAVESRKRADEYYSLVGRKWTEPHRFTKMENRLKKARQAVANLGVIHWKSWMNISGQELPIPPGGIGKSGRENLAVYTVLGNSVAGRCMVQRQQDGTWSYALDGCFVGWTYGGKTCMEAMNTLGRIVRERVKAYAEPVK